MYLCLRSTATVRPSECSHSKCTCAPSPLTPTFTLILTSTSSPSPSPGAPLRDFTYIDDIVDGIVAALEPYPYPKPKP